MKPSQSHLPSSSWWSFSHFRPRSIARAVPRLLSMYQAGQLKLDELVTRTYSLEEINEGYQDMRDDKNIRGVIVFD